MIRISKLTDYGVVILTHLADAKGENPRTARNIAADVNLPLPTVSKILKTLGREGILVSQRGIKGGYTLSGPADGINVAEIIGALEGPIAMTECTIFGDVECDHESDCPVRANWQIINQAVAKALSGITLADMMLPSLGEADGSGGSHGSTEMLNVMTINEERV